MLNVILPPPNAMVVFVAAGNNVVKRLPKTRNIQGARAGQRQIRVVRQGVGQAILQSSIVDIGRARILLGDGQSANAAALLGKRTAAGISLRPGECVRPVQHHRAVVGDRAADDASPAVALSPTCSVAPLAIVTPVAPVADPAVFTAMIVPLLRNVVPVKSLAVPRVSVALPNIVRLVVPVILPVPVMTKLLLFAMSVTEPGSTAAFKVIAVVTPLVSSKVTFVTLIEHRVGPIRGWPCSNWPWC